MIFGMTNAGGGGLKYVTGSFTSSNTATQSTFTVSGLDFEPRAIAVYSASYSAVGNASYQSILIGGFTDFELNTGFYVSKDTTSTYSRHFAGSNFTVSGSNGTYTFTTRSSHFSNISSNKGYYASFTYYIYG